MSTILVLISGCVKDQLIVDPLIGLDDDIFKEEEPYPKVPDSVGTLTEGYFQNTEGLLLVNSRLRTLCVSYGKCEKDKVDEPHG